MILSVLAVLIDNAGIGVDGFKLIERLNSDKGVVLIDVTDVYPISDRYKRTKNRDYYNLYSSDYDQGYYEYPVEQYSPNSIRRDQGNFQYSPVLSYKTVKAKKKRLFVPNLFG